MEWHSNIIRPNFVPRSSESSFNFLFNCNLEPFPDVKQAEMMMTGAHMMAPATERSAGGGYVGGNEMGCLSSQLEKKKRLTSEQLESLENSFQEEIKLDPDRKIKLARDLGLQPRQVAVWFQNRRARWKAKQLERLYDSLKLEFDAVSLEKQKLQDEVMKLRAMLMEQATRNNQNNINVNTKQVSIGCTEVSGGDETVESTSAQQPTGVSPQQSGVAGGGDHQSHYLFSNGIDYDYVNTLVSTPLGPSYWPSLPANYP